MVKKLHGCVLGLMLTGAVATACAADDRKPPDAAAAISDETVSRLESLANEQQKKIESLERQAASVSDSEQDAQRADAMREQIRAILNEQEFRESLMSSTTQAGYDNGFFIKDSADSFMMQWNGVSQFRFTHYATRADNRYLLPRRQRNDRTGFDLQRLRISMKGYLFDKDLTYNLTMRADAPDGYNTRVHYAFVNYRVHDALQFQAGMFRLASTRAQFQSDQNFNLMDRPMTDVVFGLDRGVGARIWGKFCNNRLEYYVDVVNSLNGSTNRTITTDPAELDSNPAILARLVWHALGDEPGKDFVADADLPKHNSPALNFGMHYAFNDDQGDARTLRIPFPRKGWGPGGFGLTNSNGLQINQFGFDAGFKYCGLSLISEYYLRIQDVRRAGRTPFTPLWLLTGDDSTNVQHGAYAQAGYFLPIPGMEDKFEAVTRIGGISTLAGGREGTWEYTGGVNYYIKGNKVKLQADVTKVSEVPISSSPSSLANVNDDALVFRLQLQVSF